MEEDEKGKEEIKIGFFSSHQKLHRLMPNIELIKANIGRSIHILSKNPISCSNQNIANVAIASNHKLEQSYPKELLESKLGLDLKTVSHTLSSKRLLSTRYFSTTNSRYNFNNPAGSGPFYQPSFAGPSVQNPLDELSKPPKYWPAYLLTFLAICGFLIYSNSPLSTTNFREWKFDFRLAHQHQKIIIIIK